METLSVPEARRLALARAGLLKSEWIGMPSRAPESASRQRRACHDVIERLGYLQLDTVSVAGARSHALVLMSRLRGLDVEVAEELLRPGAPLFEYWGHEVSWLPMSLYPVFDFRRREYRDRHPWWGPVVAENRAKARAIKRRIRDEGPLGSSDFEDDSERSDWGFNVTKRILHALWSSGELAVRERRRFKRYYDLTERVIPGAARREPLPKHDAIRLLLLRALEGHGWAETRTLAQTWRLDLRRNEIRSRLAELEESGAVAACTLAMSGREPRLGWIRPSDLELAARLRKLRPREDESVLLSPFDNPLWDRDRVRRLFDFDQVLEVFKPARQRKYGYFCLPVLAGDALVARCDLKAVRSEGRLDVLSVRHESKPTPSRREAVRKALRRYARAVGLRLERRSAT